MRLSRTAGNRCGECATYVISLSPGLDPHCFILSFITADVRSRHEGTFRSRRVRRCAASGPLIRPGDEAEELGVEVEVKVRRQRR